MVGEKKKINQRYKYEIDKKQAHIHICTDEQTHNYKQRKPQSLK